MTPVTPVHGAGMQVRTPTPCGEPRQPAPGVRLQTLGLGGEVCADAVAKRRTVILTLVSVHYESRRRLNTYTPPPTASLLALRCDVEGNAEPRLRCRQRHCGELSDTQCGWLALFCDAVVAQPEAHTYM